MGFSGQEHNHHRYADDTIQTAEREEELKTLLMRVKEESERTGLKLSTKKTKIMASSSITSGQIEGDNVEAVTDFPFLGSRITVDSDYSCEIKRCLVLGRKAMTKPNEHIKMQRHHFANKGPYSQSYGFSSIMYRCESWIIKVEHQGVDAFELWCWEDS